MFDKTLIIGGGVVDIQFAKDYIKDKGFDTVVCADSGLDVAYQLGLDVDFAMGDFDSVSGEVYQRYTERKKADGSNTEFVSYPPEKDATDMQIVLDWVVDKLPGEIQILGATGRRLDHFWANVNILMKPLSYGIKTSIVDEHNRLYLLDHSHIFRKGEMFGKYVSLLPLTEEVSAVYLRGFKYELNGQNLTIGSSLGVSNELASDCEAALLEFGDGVLIIVESCD